MVVFCCVFVCRCVCLQVCVCVCVLFLCFWRVCAKHVSYPAIEVCSFSRYSTQRLIGADGHALLVVRGGLIVGVDDGVGGHAVGVVGLGPGVNGVDIIEHGEGENGKHFNCASNNALATTRLPYQRSTRHTCWSAQLRTRGKSGSGQKLQKAPGATTHTTPGE